MVKTVVFDKTGTLTDDCLKVMGHRSVIKKKKALKYSCLNDDVMHHGSSEEDFIHNEHMKYAMATCQSTKYIGDKLIGNPHDIKIFEYIGWTQKDKMNDDNGYAFTIVKPSDKNFPEDKETNLKFCDENVELKIFK